MPKYDKIDALITDLNRHKKLLSALFDRRMSTVQEEAVLDLMEGDGEKLERLAAYGLLVRAKGQVSLESRVQSFFEEYLEVDETVHVLYIQEHLDKIKELKSYYLKETACRAQGALSVTHQKTFAQHHPGDPAQCENPAQQYR